MKQFIEQAKKIISINSATADGNEEIANYFLELCQDAGMKASLQLVSHSVENFSKRQFNLIGILGDPLVDRKTRKGLLLNTHLDTVGPGIMSNWTETGGKPHSAVVKDGKIFGLGSADVKLDFLCKLKAVEKFRERKLKMPIYLVGTCGEEVGMFGAKYLIKSMSLNPKFVVVGEPSDLKVVYAHKCLNMFKISVDYQLVERDARGFNRRIELFSLGESAHGSYPHLGRNAILQGIEFLQGAENSGFELRFTGLDGGDSKNKVPDKAKFEFFLSSHQFEDFKRYFRERVQSKQLERAFRLEFGGLGDTGVRFLPDVLFPCVSEVVKFFKELSAEFEKTRDESYNPPSSTINLALIQQRPSGMDLFFDLRLLPDLPADEAQEKIAAGIQKIALKFPMLNVASVRERMNPPLNLTLEHELVQHCKEAMIGAGIPPIFDKKATSTEAAQYFNAGYEAIVFGPGKSMGNSHSPNEHNLIEHLEKAVLFYRKLIERICT